jgi:hypothetical protein
MKTKIELQKWNNETETFDVIENVTMKKMTKEQILAARNLSVSDMMEKGFSLDELVEIGEMEMAYYGPSDSHEFFDGENYYNASGQQLRDPSEYGCSSEGYTPFGDE